MGSLVTCIYEGARSASLSEEPMIDITELLNADIVLTTYDVLKEDLTHDHDRHVGDRHCLRFQKRCNSFLFGFFYLSHVSLLDDFVKPAILNKICCYKNISYMD